jgi:hypothetical protein
MPRTVPSTLQSLTGFFARKTKLKRNRLHINKRREGFVLVLTIFTVAILASMIVSLLYLTAIDLNLVKNHMCSLRAYYIAEAGIIDAIDKIRTDNLTVTEWESFFPAATQDKYNVVVTNGSPTVINSTGLAATSNFNRELEVEINVTGGSPPYTIQVQQWKEVVQ